MNRSTAITISAPQGASRSARRRARRRAARQQQQSQNPVKVQISPVPQQARSRRNPRRGRRNAASRGNPYLATILDPENVRGVKVPDAITLPTGTWTYTQDGTIVSNATHTAAIIVCPYNIINSGMNTLQDQVVTVTGGAAADYTYVAASSPTNPTTAVWAARLRPVSGYVQVYSTQPPINQAGSVCSFLIPEGTKGLNLTSFPAYCSLPYNRTNHIAESGVSRYMASDPSEFDFLDVDPTTASHGWSQATGILTGASQGSTVFGCAMTGLSDSSVIRYRVVINYEFTPGSDVVSFVDREASPSNPSWISQVNNFLVKNSSSLFTPKVASELARLGALVGTNLFDRAVNSLGGPMNRSSGLVYRNSIPAIELL